MSLQTQWDVNPWTGHRQRLNYQAVDLLIKRMAARDVLTACQQEQLWSDIQAMEITVINTTIELNRDNR